MDWDTLRVVLSVHREGGLSGAARALKISQPTVSRQLAKAEATLECKLFDRRQGRLVATEAGMIVLNDAEAIDRRLRRMQDTVRSLDSEMAGDISISLPQQLLPYCITDDLKVFQALYPDITLTLRISDAMAEFNAGTIDVVFRVEDNPRPSLWGKNIAQLDFAYFAHRDLLERYGATGISLADVDDLPLIIHDGVVNSNHAEVLERFPKGRIVARCNSLEASVAMIRNSIGIGRLPCFVGNATDDLAPIGRLGAAASRSLWVLTHKDLRSIQRIERFICFIEERFAHKPELFRAQGLARQPLPTEQDKARTPPP